MSTRLFRLSVVRFTVVRAVFLFAGVVTLVSTVVAYGTGLAFVLLIPAFVGMMQLVFALTGYCPLAMLLARLGVPEH